MLDCSSHIEKEKKAPVICSECGATAPAALADELDWLKIDGEPVCPACHWQKLKPADRGDLISLEVE